MFESKRLDGRSMAEIVTELVVPQYQPGQTVLYSAIITALNQGSDKSHTLVEAREAVYRAKTRLLRDHALALRNVPGRGYKLALATEHREMAVKHKTKADRQLRFGVQVLKNVRWGELDPQARLAHEGTLLLMSALQERQSWMERRMSKVEALIQKIGSGGDPAESSTPSA